MTEAASFSAECAQIRHRVRDLWGWIPKRQRGTLAGALLLTVIGGACTTVVPLLLGRLVDAINAGTKATGTSAIAPELLKTAVVYLGLIALAYLVRELMQAGRRLLIEDTCTRLEKHLIVALVSHVMMLDLIALMREKVGSLHGRITRSVTGSVRFLRVGFLDFLPALIAGAMAMTAAITKQPLLGLFMLVMLPVSLILTWRQLISQKGVRLKLMQAREQLDGTLVEQLTGIDYIRAANTHTLESRRIARSVEFLRRNEFRHHFVMSLFGSGKALWESLCHLAVLGAAVYLAATGRGTVGDVLVFSMLFQGVMAPLAEVHRILDEGHESSLLVADLLSLLQQPVDRCFETNGDPQPKLEQQDVLIGFKGLEVRLPLADGGVRTALSDVSLEVRRGEIIGIAGRSGCGKSTLLRALLRLVHPSDGAANLGGAPLDAVSRKSLAELVGYVSQSPFVFAGTVAQNIAYENERASSVEIQQAAQAACLHEEIMQLPSGYDTELGERGQNLSGGQRQRLALARVMLKNPPILILDEATSALDTINEAHIQEWLGAQRGQRTVLMVAHRLSTLRHSDRIVVFDDGRIVESGPYDALIERGGLFAELNASAEAGCRPAS